MIELQPVTNTFSRYEENIFAWLKNTIIIFYVEAVKCNEYCVNKRKKCINYFCFVDMLLELKVSSEL